MRHYRIFTHFDTNTARNKVGKHPLRPASEGSAGLLYGLRVLYGLLYALLYGLCGRAAHHYRFLHGRG